MNDYAVINLKTDPKLKALAAKTASKLGVSISAVLNNELRRFTTEQIVTFEIPEVPNSTTTKILERSRADIDAGRYHKFESDSDALDFLSESLS